jgi:hypothetical protein
MAVMASGDKPAVEVSAEEVGGAGNSEELVEVAELAITGEAKVETSPRVADNVTDGELTTFGCGDCWQPVLRIRIDNMTKIIERRTMLRLLIYLPSISANDNN